MKSKSYSRAMIEAVESRVLYDATALTTTLVATKLPANGTLIDQAKGSGSVKVTLTNDSAVTQKFKSLISVDADSDTLLMYNISPSIETSAIIGKKNFGVSLIAGRSKTVSVPIKITAGELADGAYTLNAVVSDPTNAISSSTTGPSLTVVAAVVTLSVTQSIAKLPATLASGAKFSTVEKVTIGNSGNFNSSPPLSVDVYATTDGIAADGTKVGTGKSGAKIAAGKTAGVTVKLASTDLADGTYTLIAAVTEPDGTVTLSPPSSAVVVGTGGTTTGGGGGGGTTGGVFAATISAATAQYQPDPLAGYAQYATEIDTTIALTNPGTTITGAETLTLYASTSATFDSTAMQVGQISLSPTIGSGSSTLRADFGLSAGPTYSENDYYIFVVITPASTGNPLATAAYGSTIQFDGNIVG